MQDSNPANCLGSPQESCYRNIEEDCEYNGKVISTTQTADERDCNETCKILKDLGCSYWYFAKPSNCTTYDSHNRTCNAIGGPQKPSFEECLVES